MPEKGTESNLAIDSTARSRGSSRSRPRSRHDSSVPKAKRKDHLNEDHDSDQVKDDPEEEHDATEISCKTRLMSAACCVVLIAVFYFGLYWIITLVTALQREDINGKHVVPYLVLRSLCELSKLLLCILLK